ncbi:DUF1353 domain-containing protein [Pseudomonas umsongensis]
MINRRRFVSGAAASVVLFPYCLYSRAAKESENVSKSAEEWVAELNATKASDSPLILQRFLEPVYILVNPIVWTPNVSDSIHKKVEVPKGFVTDLASIPRVFWSLLRPDADYAYAAIVHDYLYWLQATGRKEADDILKFSMEDLEVDKVTVATIYNAVRAFGESAWNENKARKNAGERRVLKDFPSTAKVKWSEWKIQKQHFVAD